MLLTIETLPDVFRTLGNVTADIAVIRLAGKSFTRAPDVDLMSDAWGSQSLNHRITNSVKIGVPINLDVGGAPCCAIIVLCHHFVLLTLSALKQRGRLP